MLLESTTSQKSQNGLVAQEVEKTLGDLYDLPKPVALLDGSRTQNATAAETLAKRHKCLQAIRMRQQNLLIPIVSAAVGATADNTNSSLQTREIDILLVDPAYHPNVGDHMITVGEQSWAQRAIDLLEQQNQQQDPNNGRASWSSNSPRYKITYHECNVIQAQSYADTQKLQFVPSCSDLLAQQQQQHQPPNEADSQTSTTIVRLALWHGGGNWGDLWPPIQDLRTKSFQDLLKTGYTIIGMPQSLFFSNDEAEQRSAQQVRENVEQGLGLNAEDEGVEATTGKFGDDELSAQAKKRVFLTWREQASHDKAHLLYPYVSHLLVPDIAFQLGPYRPPNGDISDDGSNGGPAVQVDILLLLRSDHESIIQIDRQSVMLILSQLQHDVEEDGDRHGQRPVTFSIVDWPDRLDRFLESDSESKSSRNFLFTDTAIQLLNSGRIVVCDRLHATILAYLSGLSFVYLDQVSGKISKTMDVAMSSHRSCRPDDDGGGEWNKQANHFIARDNLVPPPPPWWAQASNLTHGLQIAVQMLRTMKRLQIGPRQGKRNR